MPIMRSESGPKFTSLKREPSKLKMESPATVDYPSVYLNKMIPGIGEGDIGNMLRAEVKLVPTRITRSETNGDKSVSLDCEIREIRIL